MITILAIAAIAVWLVYYGQRPRTGAGASADARARQLRTLRVRLADALGIQTRRGQQAARYRAGAEGERRTAARLAPLSAEGWTILHDRALPTSRANVDHLAISPSGAVILPDTKRWSSRYRLRVVEGRLLHGTRDVTNRLRGIRHETATVSTVLGVHVTPLVIMDGAPIAGGELVLDGIRIVPADRACDVLRALGRIPGQRQPADLAQQAARLLPEYTRARR
ncbi:NERD domain-containing protein [Streptomyces kasugaensis]|uniref:NERD domain-containing protein n=1 Tax=Streptomyces kasugaensis TaxID=1946 RepID=A0A4Q9HRD7_STRKA|nr:nuclease-related domain-containing protein [Streptomyces kasugaensis]TBO57534.1 NERD domain-containing protein [Streptomyces kasugaensis]